MSTSTTVATWMLATVTVAGGVFVAVQQMKPEPVVSVEAPTIQAPEIEIRQPPVAEVVRIDDGMATIAGEGNPGETLVIMDGDQEVARTTIGSDGTFALVFDYDVPETGSILEMSEQNTDGQIIKADRQIAVVPKFAQETLVASLDNNAIKVEVDNRSQLNFAGAVYGQSAEATLSGSTTPNTTVTLKLNGVDLASVSSGETGQWQYVVPTLDAGQHKLEITTSDAQNLSVNLERAQLLETTRIARGDSLWRIAEDAYGDGFRYVDIYNLNAEKITDPNLIYPDQEILVKKY